MNIRNKLYPWGDGNKVYGISHGQWYETNALIRLYSGTTRSTIARRNRYTSLHRHCALVAWNGENEMLLFLLGTLYITRRDESNRWAKVEEFHMSHLCTPFLLCYCERIMLFTSDTNTAWSILEWPEAMARLPEKIRIRTPSITTNLGATTHPAQPPTRSLETCHAMDLKWETFSTHTDYHQSKEKDDIYRPWPIFQHPHNNQKQRSHMKLINMSLPQKDFQIPICKKFAPWEKQTRIVIVNYLLLMDCNSRMDMVLKRKRILWYRSTRKTQ